MASTIERRYNEMKMSGAGATIECHGMNRALEVEFHRIKIGLYYSDPHLTCRPGNSGKWWLVALGKRLHRPERGISGQRGGERQSL